MLRCATRTLLRRHAQRALLLSRHALTHALRRHASSSRELTFAEELLQQRKTKGKTIAALREDGTTEFPAFDAVDVDGTAVAFPDLLERRVTLVGG